MVELLTLVGIGAGFLLFSAVLRRLNQTGLSGSVKRLPASKQKRVVVMTGATTGLGVHTAELIADLPNTRLIVGARGTQRKVPDGVEVLPLDLTSLASVRAFADSVKRQIGATPIDSLILNAATQTHSVQKSADGFELTYAVNHLAHYLLARLLLPNLGIGGRLVIVTSDTHDPNLIPFGPKSIDPQKLAHADDYGMGTYASSKLANILTAASFIDLPEVKARQITVIAYNPGLTDGTALARDAILPARIVLTIFKHTLLPFLGAFVPAMAISTAERSGEALAEISLGSVIPPPGRYYDSMVKGQHTWPNPSELACKKEAQDLLWRESAPMVGLKA